MKLARYDKYKLSGIEWLPEAPVHWNTKRLKYLCTINDETLPESTSPDYELLYVDIGSVDATEGIQKKEPMIFETAPSRARRVVRDGDTIVSTVRTYLRAVAPIQNPEENLIVSTGFTVVRPKGIDPNYLAYCLRSSYFIETVVSRSVGVSYPATNPTDVSCIELPLPPVEEQQTIARFLDAKTAQIDELIAKKRQLIGKLKEKRQALIARTVTRGLPPEAAQAAGLEPNPEMKDSGVEWLEQMPKKWVSVPLSYLVKMRGGATPDKGKPEYWEGEIPWVSPKDMKTARIFDSEDHISEEGLRNSPLSLIPASSLLIVVRGMILAHSFPVAISIRELTINQDMKALVCSNKVKAEYLYWALCGFSSALVALADESAHGTKKIESSMLARFPILVPPLAEQQTVANYLDRETAQLDALAVKVESAITRLTEYRLALITSAITGKIDVRQSADQIDPLIT